jgi:isopenicillin N synthase-like dioxygenase
MVSDDLPIPIVDISALFGTDTIEMAQTAGELGKAARSFGFLYVTGHGLATGLFDDLLRAAKQFFAQSLERKMQVYIGKSRNHRGYVPEGEEILVAGTQDAKEAFDCARDLPADDPEFLAGNPLLGPNQWPDVPGFKAAVSAYYDAAFGIGRVLMRGFALAMGEPAGLFDSFLTRPPSQLRLIHYPYNPDATDRSGFGAHTDYECFTLLRSTAPGLEVMNESGLWIDAPPISDAYLVNIGDMVELWTNGEFIATSHRVRKVREERFSFPLFFALDYPTRIAPMPRFVRPDRSARPGLIAGEHLFAQTAQTFAYLRRRVASGELVLPEQSLALSSFGHQARLGVT